MTDPTTDPSPENESPSDSGTAHSGSADGEHLAAIEVEPEPSEEAGAGDGPAVSIAGIGADGFMTKEAFHHGFCMAFQLAGELTELETLKAAPGRPAAAACSGSIYDSAREVHWLNWILRPDSIWLQRAVLIGAFTVPLAVEVKRERVAKRAKDVTPAAADAAPAAEPEPFDHKDGAAL